MLLPLFFSLYTISFLPYTWQILTLFLILPSFASISFLHLPTSSFFFVTLHTVKPSFLCTCSYSFSSFYSFIRHCCLCVTICLLFPYSFTSFFPLHSSLLSTYNHSPPIHHHCDLPPAPSLALDNTSLQIPRFVKIKIIPLSVRSGRRIPKSAPFCA